MEQRTYSRATTAELNKDWDQAFHLYIKAAENFIHISKTTTEEQLRSKCKSSAGKALERAEKIKGSGRDLTPVSLDPFAERTYNNIYFPL